nr:unnamed protein product [Digitaria exilis]
MTTRSSDAMAPALAAAVPLPAHLSPNPRSPPQLADSVMLCSDGRQCRPLTPPPDLPRLQSAQDRATVDERSITHLVRAGLPLRFAARRGVVCRLRRASSHRRVLSCRRAWIAFATSEKHTLRGDETVDLAEHQRVRGLEELHLGDLGSSAAAAAGGGRGGVRLVGADAGDAEDDEGDVVPGVASHHLAGGGRPVQPLHLPAGVLDHHGRRLRRLAIAHLLLLSSSSCSRDLFAAANELRVLDLSRRGRWPGVFIWVRVVGGDGDREGGGAEEMMDLLGAGKMAGRERCNSGCLWRQVDFPFCPFFFPPGHDMDAHHISSRGAQVICGPPTAPSMVDWFPPTQRQPAPSSSSHDSLHKSPPSRLSSAFVAVLALHGFPRSRIGSNPGMCETLLDRCNRDRYLSH